MLGARSPPSAASPPNGATSHRWRCLTQRPEADPGIAVHHWDIWHNILVDGPDRVPDLLRNLPNYAGTTTQQPGQPD